MSIEIDNVANGIANKPSPKVARNEAPPPPPAEKPTDKPNERTETARPAPPRRPPPLINTVSQSLGEAGLATTAPDAVTGVGDAESTATDNDPATAQSEKVAQALQAFVSSLVQAANANRTAAPAGTGLTESVTQPAPAAAQPTASAASAYEGLASRLEGLVLEIDSDPTASRGNETLARLDSAFRDLVNASAGSGSKTGAAPELQAVLKNIARNLQSTGDPTLASTGNVINTAA
jgi:hypothetical protein